MRRQRKTFRRRRYLRRERSKARTRVTSTARQQGAAGKKRCGGREKLSAEDGICGEKGIKRGHESLRRHIRKMRRGRHDAAARQQGAAKKHGRMKKKRHQSATNCKPKHKKKTRNISDPFFAIRAACAETFGTGAPLRYFRFYAGFSSRPVGKPRRRSVRAPPLLRDFYSLPSGYSEKYSVGEPNLRFLTPL